MVFLQLRFFSAVAPRGAWAPVLTSASVVFLPALGTQGVAPVFWEVACGAWYPDGRNASGAWCPDLSRPLSSLFWASCSGLALRLPSPSSLGVRGPALPQVTPEAWEFFYPLLLLGLRRPLDKVSLALLSTPHGCFCPRILLPASTWVCVTLRRLPFILCQAVSHQREEASPP